MSTKNKIPIRLQRSRQQKQIRPNGLPIVYVGRPTRWGNPFKVGDKGIPTREVSVALYRDWIEKRNSIKQIPPTKEEIKKELGDKNLTCWCPLDGPCHADILLKISNENK